jgi:uncharacterized protein YcbK (DUF882 family)
MGKPDEMGVAGALTTRRAVLRGAFYMGGAMAAGALLAPLPGLAASHRSVSLYNLHTGERLQADYVVGGRYQRDELRAIARLLRDHRTGDVHTIDPRLLDILAALRERLGSRHAFHVVSGFRSRVTNEMRRRESGAVAKNSFHLTGRAADLFLPDRRLRDLRTVALRLGAGGVGFYPESNFVHLDTGPVRGWFGA